jgi:predicted KAP-like P-loop ATPase
MDSPRMDADQPSKSQWADRPIESAKEDLLGRAPFADALAKAVSAWGGKDSLVIALYGSWGSGKTSLKNMVCEALRSAANPPLLIEFNPWRWSSQEQIFSAFFKAIADRLGSKSESEQARRLAASWKKYAAYVALATTLPDLLKGLFMTLAIVFGALGIGSLFVPSPWMVSVFLVVLALASLLATSSKVAARVGEAFEARAQAAIKDLDAHQEDVVGGLKKLGQLVLIVIDDIDRLGAREIRQMMQLIKANADFPGVVYLLPFQRNVVENALGGMAEGGADYLAKIVQLGYDIPATEGYRLDRVLLAGFEQILGFEAANRRFSRERWRRTYRDGIRPYFRTLRDAHRFLPVLEFHVALFRKENVFEVNPVDLLGLETLRVFEPAVHRRLFGMKEQLVGSAEHDEQARIAIGEALMGSQNDGAASAILRGLFPRVAKASNRSLETTDETAWYRDMRACHADVFDRYFLLTLPEGDIAPAELEKLLSATADQREFTRLLRVLVEQGAIAVALNRLDYYKTEIPREHAVGVIASLFDIGDELPEEPRFWGGIMSSVDHARRIVHWVLEKYPGPESRAPVLRDAVLQSGGLFLPVRYVSRYDDDFRQQEESQGPGLLPNDQEFLRTSLLGRIREFATDGRLSKVLSLGFILTRWRAWGEREEPRQWVERLIQTREGALAFLCGMSGRQDSADGVSHVVDLKDVELFVPFETLENRLQSIEEPALTEKQRSSLQSFRRAVQRRLRGLPDDPFHTERE